MADGPWDLDKTRPDTSGRPDPAPTRPTPSPSPGAGAGPTAEGAAGPADRGSAVPDRGSAVPDRGSTGPDRGSAFHGAAGFSTDDPTTDDPATDDSAAKGAAAKGAAAGLRASDEDRTRTADWLCWAAGTGQLTFDEVDDRLARAYAARTVDELAALTADLQARPRPEPPAPPRPPLGERLRGLVLDGPVPYVLLAAFVLAMAFSHGHVWFPWPLIWVGIFVARRHHRHPHGPDHPRGPDYHRGPYGGNAAAGGAGTSLPTSDPTSSPAPGSPPGASPGPGAANEWPGPASSRRW